MKFIELVKTRQSVRKYIDKAVSEEMIARCLDAALLAPSASNGQPWKFIVVNEPELCNEVAEATYGPMQAFNKFAPQAPVIVGITMEKIKTITQIGAAFKKKEYPLFDIGIAAEHFCLQAAEEGLGTCMLGWFDEAKIKKLLSIPKKKRLLLLITLGYAPEDYKLREKIRKPREEVVSYNKY